MNKLIVNPGTEMSWEIPLNDGITTLGSDPALPYSIAHDSVSPAHCEITVTDGKVTVHDLGSVCGTFLNHAPATADAQLISGQILTLGEVELHFTSDTSVAPLPIPKRIAPMVRAVKAGATEAAVNAACKYHRGTFATWHCETCQADFCDLCVNVRRVGESVRHLCRKCGNDCSPITIARSDSPVEESFYSVLPKAFAYPFKGSGVVLIVAGAVVFTAIGQFMLMARYAFLFGLVAIVMCSLFTTGYLFSYAKSVIASTGQGSNEPPDWPDFTNWGEDILAPCFQALCLFTLTFGPGIVFRYWQPFGEDISSLLSLALLFSGALLAPMGMLALGIFDNLGALNPVTLVWSIARIPLTYLAAAISFELILGAFLIVAQIRAPSFLIAILLVFISRLVLLYAILVAMRILGLLYRTEKHRLGWP